MNYEVVGTKFYDMWNEREKYEQNERMVRLLI